MQNSNDLDPVRRRIVELAERQGLTLKQLSLKLGRNHAYIQQFVRRGSPRELSESTRIKLAAIFGVLESELKFAKIDGQPTAMRRVHSFSDNALVSFAMRLAMVRLNSAHPTPARFANFLGFSIERYSELENGLEDPTLHELNVVSQAGVISLDWLIRGSEQDLDDTAALDISKSDGDLDRV